MSTSRRRFMSKLAAGAAGSVLSLGGANKSFAADPDSAFVKLDSLLVTYMHMPPRGVGEFFWTMTGRWTIAFRLRALEDEEIVFVPDIPREGKSFDLHQLVSTQFPNAMVFRGYGGGSGRGSLSASHEDTLICGVGFPTMHLGGIPSQLHFYFSDQDFVFTDTVGNVQNCNDDCFDAETGLSWLKRIPDDPARIVEPRFRLLTVLSIPNTATNDYMINGPGDDPDPVIKKATTIAKIVEQRGFTSRRFQRAFAEGKKLEVIYGSTQERTGTFIRMRARFSRPEPGAYKIYWDRIFKALYFVERRTCRQIGAACRPGQSRGRRRSRGCRRAGQDKAVWNSPCDADE